MRGGDLQRRNFGNLTTLVGTNSLIEWNKTSLRLEAVSSVEYEEIGLPIKGVNKLWNSDVVSEFKIMISMCVNCYILR